MSNQQSCPNSDRDAWCGPWCRHPAVGTVRSRNPQSYCRGSWILGGLPQTRTLWLPPVQPAAQLFSPAVALVPPAKPSQILHVQVHPWWSQQDEKEAFQLYLQKFGECRDGSNPGGSLRCSWRRGRVAAMRERVPQKRFLASFRLGRWVQKGFAARWSASSDSLIGRCDLLPNRHGLLGIVWPFG